MSLKRKKPLRKLSKKRAIEYGKYILARARFLPGKFCEFPAMTCPCPATEIHHSRGRIGSLLNDQRYWWPICSQHHAWIHSHGKEARKLGLLK